MNTASRTSSSPSLARRMRALLGDAFAAGLQDLTQGSVRRAVLVLAIPMVLEMAMESVFAITDIFFVAALGADAVAAVGLTEAVMTLVYALAVGLGMGATALVARRVGGHDDDGAARVVGQGLWLGTAAALAVGVPGALHGGGVLRMMGADAALAAGGSGYACVMLGGAASIVYVFLLNAAFRGAGLPVVAMRALALSNALNIVLDPCLIFGAGPLPALGLTGAAIATTTGRSVGVLYLLAAITRGEPHLRLRRAHLVVDSRLMAGLVGVSLGGIAQFVAATASWVVLMRLVAAHGAAAIAGFTIAVRVIDFTLLPAWGLSNAAATLVGQSLGARDLRRASRSVAVVMRYTVACMVAVAVVFLGAAEPLAGLFTAAPGVAAQAVDCLRLVALGYGFFAVGLVLTQAFNGAGDTWTPTVVNLVSFWLVQIPLAWWLAGAAGLGPRGVFAAISVAETSVALLTWWLFRRGTWRSVEV